MNLQEEGRQIRTEITKLRPDRRRRYSDDLRARILSWVERAEAAGMPRAECVKQLGMNNVWRIASWQDQLAAARSKETGVALVRIDAPFSSSSVVLVTPSGYRVEGLTLEQLAVLLREIA
jgi:hypothetical protein